MRPRQRLARRVRARERLGPVGHRQHSNRRRQALMRDVIAGVVALVAAARWPRSLATTLQLVPAAAAARARFRAGAGPHDRRRDSRRRRPACCSARTTSASTTATVAIDKDLIAAVRVLINGAPIAAYVSRRHARAGRAPGDQLRGSARRHRARSLGRRHRDGRRARCWSSAARFASGCRRSWRGRCSTR